MKAEVPVFNHRLGGGKAPRIFNTGIRLRSLTPGERIHRTEHRVEGTVAFVLN